MFLKKLFIKYTENERLLLSATFMAKFELHFLRDFILTPTEKSIGYFTKQH